MDSFFGCHSSFNWFFLSIPSLLFDGSCGEPNRVEAVNNFKFTVRTFFVCVHTDNAKKTAPQPPHCIGNQKDRKKEDNRKTVQKIATKPW